MCAHIEPAAKKHSGKEWPKEREGGLADSVGRGLGEYFRINGGDQGMVLTCMDGGR